MAWGALDASRQVRLESATLAAYGFGPTQRNGSGQTRSPIALYCVRQGKLKWCVWN